MSATVCRVCNHSGQTTMLEDLGNNKFREVRITCPRCNGYGLENFKPSKQGPMKKFSHKALADAILAIDALLPEKSGKK